MDLGGGGPQDLKIEMPKKKGENTVNKTTKKLFIKMDNSYRSYIVVDNLSFYKM